MRFVPRSLFCRLVLVLLGGLLVAQAVAQPAHLHVDCAVERRRVAREHEIDQLVPGEDAARVIQEDAQQSMPPYELWLSGRDDILRWWVGPGAGCRGSRVIPTLTANGSPAFWQYRPSASGGGHDLSGHL